MDAFAITGVSPEGEWFRVQAAVGGEDSPARLFPRVHVLRSTGIADLASGGRKIYFQQAGDTPLVPLAPDEAESFDPLYVPVEEIPEFAFDETATDEDVEALISIRNADEPDARGLDVFERLEELGWAAQDDSGTVSLTPVGEELLRHRLA